MKRTTTWLSVAAGVGVALGVGWWLTHRFQVFSVLSVSGAAGSTYARGPSKWFANKDAALAWARSSAAVTKIAPPTPIAFFVADRGGSILEAFKAPGGTPMTGETIDALIVAAEKKGVKLDNSKAVA